MLLFTAHTKGKNGQEKATTRGQAIMPSPYRPNAYYGMPHPGAQQGVPPYQVKLVSPYQAKPVYGPPSTAINAVKVDPVQSENAPSPEFIDKNLENILAAFGGEESTNVAASKVPKVAPSIVGQNRKPQGFRSKADPRSKPAAPLGVFGRPNGIPPNPVGVSSTGNQNLKGQRLRVQTDPRTKPVGVEGTLGAFSRPNGISPYPVTAPITAGRQAQQLGAQVNPPSKPMNMLGSLGTFSRLNGQPLKTVRAEQSVVKAAVPYQTQNVNFVARTQQQSPYYNQKSIQTANFLPFQQRLFSPVRILPSPQGQNAAVRRQGALPRPNGKVLPQLKGQRKSTFLNPRTSAYQQKFLNRLPAAQWQRGSPPAMNGITMPFQKQALGMIAQKQLVKGKRPLAQVGPRPAQMQGKLLYSLNIPVTNPQGDVSSPEQMKNPLVYNIQQQAQLNAHVPSTLPDTIGSAQTKQNVVTSKNSFPYLLVSKANLVPRKSVLLATASVPKLTPLPPPPQMLNAGQLRAQSLAEGKVPQSNVQPPVVQWKTPDTKAPISTMQASVQAAAQPQQTTVSKLRVAPYANKLGSNPRMVSAFQPQATQLLAPKPYAPQPQAPLSQVLYHANLDNNETQQYSDKTAQRPNLSSTVYNPKALAWLRKEYRLFGGMQRQPQTIKPFYLQTFDTTTSRRTNFPQTNTRRLYLFPSAGKPVDASKLSYVQRPSANILGQKYSTSAQIQQRQSNIPPQPRQQDMNVDNPLYKQQPYNVGKTDREQTERLKPYTQPPTNQLDYGFPPLQQTPKAAAKLIQNTEQRNRLQQAITYYNNRLQTGQNTNANLTPQGKTVNAYQRSSLLYPSYDRQYGQRSPDVTKLFKQLLYLKHKKKRKKRKIEQMRKKSFSTQKLRSTSKTERERKKTEHRRHKKSH